MAILNYTTKVPSARTAQEIQAILSKASARAVMTEFDDKGEATHIAFRIQTPQGLMAYRLPSNSDGVFKVMQRDNKVPRILRTKEQAQRVAWRIVKDWVEAQMAVIASGIVALEQVFLPYAQTKSGQTVYECFEEKGLQALTYEGD